MTGQGRASDTTLPPLTFQQRIDWLRLIRSDNVGPVTFRVLVNRYGGAAPALDALPDLARRGGSRHVRLATVAEAERELAALERMGGRLVAMSEPDYPPLLAAIDSAPPLLAVMGDGAVVRRPAVAVVGSRNASAAGRTFTRQIVEALGSAGYVVVSGLARGIDTAAHEAALRGGTAAVLAGGLDRLYPPENAGLFAEIVARGVVLSEMPLGWQAQARDFPRRNRIVAGMCAGTLVVEAAERSGSLITARLAGEFGREVFAVPGSPLDPRCAGSNGLLRDGATLVARPADLLDALAAQRLTPVEPSIAFRSGEAQGDSDEAEPPPRERERIVAALGPTPVEIDVLVREADSSARVVAVVLLELDLAGRLERHAGGRVSLLP